MTDAHDFEDNIETYMRLLIRHGECRIPDAQWSRKSRQIFYDYFTTVLDAIDMGFLLLETNVKEKTFRIDKNLQKNHAGELGKYRWMFEERFDWYLGAAFDDEDMPGQEEEPPLLPYCVEDRDYVERGMEHLFGLYSHQEMPDDYGWTKTRKKTLNRGLGRLACDYALPCFALSFNEHGIPQFKATQLEIEKTIALYNKRSKERLDIEHAIYAPNDRKVGMIELDKSRTEDEKNNILPEMTEKSERETAKAFMRLQKKWCEENKKHPFPSAVKAAPVEPLQIDPATDPLETAVLDLGATGVWKTPESRIDPEIYAGFNDGLIQILKNGFYEIPLQDWSPNYLAGFYYNAEDCFIKSDMQACPLYCNKKKMIISFDPRFRKRVDSEDFKTYRAEVLDELQRVKSHEDQARDFQNDDMPVSPGAGIAQEYIEDSGEEENLSDEEVMDGEADEDEYQYNEGISKAFYAHLSCGTEKYVQYGLNKLFEISDDAAPDDYGPIENRPAMLLNAVTELNKDYCLPDLAVKIQEDGTPCFIASAREVKDYLALYRRREAENMAQLKACENNAETLALLQEKWQAENGNYDFPSATHVPFYDTACTFFYNSIEMERLISVKDTSEVSCPIQEFKLKGFDKNAAAKFVLS